jgi:HK97 family phage major capsid protein
MDPELKKMLEELRASVGKSVEVLPKIDAIEKRVIAGEASATEAKKALDELRSAMEAQKKEIDEIRKQARVQAIERDGVHERNQGLRMLGMQVRALLAQHLRVDVPAEFRGEAELLTQHRATLQAGSGGGSYLVPTITETEILDTVEELSDLLSRADFKPGLPGKMLLPTLTARPILRPKRSTVDTAATASDPAIGQISFDPDEMYIFFPVDNRVLQMSPVQLGSFCLDLVRDGAIEGLCKWLVEADGTASFNSLTGILNEATYLNTMPGGKKAFADLAKTDLTGLKAKTLKRGRGPRGVFLMAEDVFGVVEDMDRTGKVPVITYGQDGAPRILQNRVVIDESMPDLSTAEQAGKGFLGFGDLATYLVGLVGGIEIGTSDQVFFNKMQTCFRGVLNGSIVRKTVSTFRTLKTAAA